MQLFKRVLLSLFPDEIANQNINPASMFVSFISTKEFFSVINRKIIENYKLNLFDIALDPFEFKTGFGDNPQIKPKDSDNYYGYSATANINGYRFLNCANISNAMTLVSSIYTKDIFAKHGSNAYLNFLYTTYLLSFVFTSRIKVFPHQDREENFNRFVSVFFDFYEFVFSQTGKKITKEEIKEIKKDILSEVETFFMLFSVYQRLNNIFDNPSITNKETYSWIFQEELSGDNRSIINEYIENCDKYNSQTNFSGVETKILQFILPADILIRYLFLDMDMFLVTENIVSKIYDKKILNKYMSNFHKNDALLEEFILYITDYKHFKKNFFSGVQKYILTILRKDNINGMDVDDELDDLMSSIGDDIENVNDLKIPERIKKESKIMEKILNFYITYIGGFWISRGDSFFLRMFRKPLIQEIAKDAELFDTKSHNVYYYGSLLYNYGKNLFYYKFASDNIRAGKQKFFLPYKSNIKNIYSNIQILKSFDENFLATILQDINPKDIRISVNTKKILDLFKTMFGKQISLIVKEDKKGILENIYHNLSLSLNDPKKFIKTCQKHLTQDDIYHIKENIYNLDFWVSQSLQKAIQKKGVELYKYYSDPVIIGILANYRETFLGLLLYISYLYIQKVTNKSKKPKDLKIELIKRLYITDVLNININDEYKEKLLLIIDNIYDEYKEILRNRISIDDNRDFLKIGADNRASFISKQENEAILKKVSGEDIIRFKGFLKNITYYNKRFLMPK